MTDRPTAPPTSDQSPEYEPPAVEELEANDTVAASPIQSATPPV
jgi:hypothetical protein